ncbi:hypothetical protein Pst134EA_022692 [Puccinia striiformis f. sp. tritici]|uniref:hypothetical protein n=1 Tax=Puccinia striiformis f. sp. tritici TaxID=168172 RepID=UPI0020072028|nr:hypothetical protein Pst134EA_022692 [Puccinia striiformis f. sp. tritici]KAH9455220.1 hypothetical protein Pst134EA_022692 [Puccinia striiformis f. sp. tritici]
MSTRRSVSTTRLPQLDDPESIIRKANTAKRLAAKATVTQSQTPATSSTTPVITKEGPGPTHSDNPTTNLLIVPATNIPASLLPPIVNLVSIPTPDDDNPPILPRPVNPASIPLPIDNLPSPFLRPHEMQNTEVPAALGNNPVFIGATIKAEEALGTPRPSSNQVDHRRFKASEGPAYTGPYQEIEPFVVWMNAIELFFTSKDISSDRDRIIIAGGRILETNLMGFFKTSASKLLLGTWEEFKAEMFTFAIPARWRTTLQRQIRFIKIGSNESFMQYTLRARTLQQLLNFDQVTVSDHELAEGMTFGLGEDLENRINELEILETKPFDFNVFVKRVGDCVRAASKKTSHSPRSIGSTSHLAQSPQTTTHLSNEEYIWRIHAYLDSVGLCHFCKKHCGNISGGCPGPLNRYRVPIPTTFKAPPKPSNYVAPQAWKGPNNRPVPSNAGRATSRPAGVAAVTDDGNGDQVDPINDADPEADELDYLASISALAIVDGELMASEINEATVSLYTGIDPASVAALWEIPEDDSDEEEYVAPYPPPNRLLHQFHAGRCLRGRVNLGSSTRSIPRAGYQIYKETSLHSKSPATTKHIAIPLHSSIPTLLICPSPVYS